MDCQGENTLSCKQCNDKSIAEKHSGPFRLHLGCLVNLLLSKMGKLAKQN